MAHAWRQFPIGPLALSALLVVLGATFLARRGTEGLDVAAAPEGLVRVVSWNLADDAQADQPNGAICNALARLNADVVCLQGVSSADLAGEIGRCLGPEWRSQALPYPDGRHLAVLAGPRLEVVAYHLVPTPAGDAVALTLRRPGRPVFHVVCAEASGRLGDSDARGRYLGGVLGWHDAHPSALTVLAGNIDVDTNTRQRLATRFSEVSVAGAPSSEIRIAPLGVSVSRSATVSYPGDGNAGSEIAIADVAAP
jgi:hypothetical protein